MPNWVAALVLAAFISGALIHRAWRRHRERRAAARRVVEKPNSYYFPKHVQDQFDREWYESIRLDHLHEVNREEVERLLARIRAEGLDSLRRDERAFLERIARLEAARERRGTQPPPGDPWPRPA
ncbi:MAG: hypothetical protein D6701_09565 [Gemmatimonadetes bacterium]|nr:MAG: hypothetical protein D6701_09565 [Gemmatimonadota bacterium]